MTDIPDEIMREARAVMEAQWALGYNRTSDTLIRLIAKALLARDKRAAEIARGQIHKQRYRTWPWWKCADGTMGNRDNEHEIVEHADMIATAIETYTTAQEDGR